MTPYFACIKYQETRGSITFTNTIFPYRICCISYSFMPPSLRVYFVKERTRGSVGSSRNNWTVGRMSHWKISRSWWSEPLSRYRYTYICHTSLDIVKNIRPRYHYLWRTSNITKSILIFYLFYFPSQIFLRSLPDCVFQCELYDEWCDAVDSITTCTTQGTDSCMINASPSITNEKTVHRIKK